MDFLDRHLPEQFRQVVERAWELLPMPVLAPGDRDHILSGVFNQFLSALTEPVE